MLVPINSLCINVTVTEWGFAGTIVLSSSFLSKVFSHKWPTLKLSRQQQMWTVYNKTITASRNNYFVSLPSQKQTCVCICKEWSCCRCLHATICHTLKKLYSLTTTRFVQHVLQKISLIYVEFRKRVSWVTLIGFGCTKRRQVQQLDWRILRPLRCFFMMPPML